MPGFVFLPSDFAKRGGELFVVKRRLAPAGLGLDHDELLNALTQVVAVPEPRVVVKPMGRDPGFVNAGRHRAATTPLLLDVVSLRGGRIGGEQGSTAKSNDECQLNKAEIRRPKAEGRPKSEDRIRPIQARKM